MAGRLRLQLALARVSRQASNGPRAACALGRVGDSDKRVNYQPLLLSQGNMSSAALNKTKWPETSSKLKSRVSCLAPLKTSDFALTKLEIRLPTTVN